MKILNRSYTREYEPLETCEAGIVLSGGEVKVIRNGGLKLDGSFVRITDGTAFVFNIEIPSYKYARVENYDPRRTRQLLLHKDEISRLEGKLATAKGLTIIPVSCYNKKGRIKLEIALSRGRKDLEKRKREKERDIKRAQQKEAKEYMKN